MSARSLAALFGVIAFSFAAPAHAAVRGIPGGALTPEARYVPPSFGWTPVVMPGTASPAEPEVEAAPHGASIAGRKNVVSLREARTTAQSSFGAQSRFAGASSYAAGNLDPADVQLAVGAGDVVQLVNMLMSVWTTGGTPLKTVSLQALIGSNDRLVDPRILFDPTSGRWLVLATDVTADSFGAKIGISQTSDPTGAWWFYTWGSPQISSECLDQPRLGYSSNIVAFSANIYDGCGSPFGSVYLGTQLWALNKAQLVAGQQAQFTTWQPTTGLWSVQPVQSLTATDVEYATAVSPDSALLRVVSITGVPPAATNYVLTDLPIAPMSEPPNAVQAGSPSAIDTGTTRTLDSSWSNGTLWTAAADGCVPPGDTDQRSCARITTASTAPLQILDDRDLTLGPGTYVYYPAVRPDGLGNSVVVFGYSSSSTYPSVGVATKPVQGDWTPWTQVAAGTSAQTSGRWGDYFAAASDPLVPGRVWISGQVGGEVAGTAAGHGWNTVVGVVTPAPLAAPKVTYQAPSAHGVTQTAATVLGAVDPQYDETSYRFEYGRSTAYPLATPWVQLPAPVQATQVTAALARLYAGSLYHFRLVAKNSSGTTLGADQTFKTKAKPKPKKKKKA